jgi:penicillin V acylase-like amidase (Ntn superfamily)
MNTARRLGWVLLAAAVADVLLQQPAAACSTFVLRTGDGPVFGRNTDSIETLPGMLVVNHRGVHKRAIRWAIVGPGPADQPRAEWASRYGSVTTTAVGRELPDGGMNEAGLVVEEMTLLESAFPRVAGRQTIAQVQWIQYLLDTKASVTEVVADLDRYDLTGWTWHFMVGDKTGDCASVDFLNGRAVVHRGTLRGGCVLTNDSADKSLAALKAYVDKGAGAAEPEGTQSLSRFVRAANRVNAFASKPAPDKVAYAFQVLHDVSAGRNTVRSIVHDLAERRIYFRTPNNPAVKYLDLDDLDFAPGARVMTIDLDTAGSGDVSGRLVPYSAAANRRIVEAFYSQVVHAVPPAVAILEKELAVAGMTEAEFLDRLVAYPDGPAR